MQQILECVPNFSEGRDLTIISKITAAIERVEGVVLLHVDSGYAANRTVVTFAGPPDLVVEAAFQAIQCAAELIDMRQHQGEHPRIGATDVCPLVPIAGITIEETVEFARSLARRVGDELSIPVYCYESAALIPHRKSLANCRSGEYEGLATKLKLKEWQPDFGPSMLNAKSGLTIIGARNLLIAYNINLNTASAELANAIATEVRESGYLKRVGDSINGPFELDNVGKPIRIAGTLKNVRAIGWFIEEYGKAQVSMNLLDYKLTKLHQVFEEVSRCAKEKGVVVTGSELIGLIPLAALIEAGSYFRQKQNLPLTCSEQELIQLAIQSLGLDELEPFDPDQRIIEKVLQKKAR